MHAVPLMDLLTASATIASGLGQQQWVGCGIWRRIAAHRGVGVIQYNFEVYVCRINSPGASFRQTTGWSRHGLLKTYSALPLAV